MLIAEGHERRHDHAHLVAPSVREHVGREARIRIVHCIHIRSADTAVTWAHDVLAACTKPLLDLKDVLVLAHSTIAEEGLA